MGPPSKRYYPCDNLRTNSSLTRNKIITQLIKLSASSRMRTMTHHFLRRKMEKLLHLRELDLTKFSVTRFYSYIVTINNIGWMVTK